MAGVVQARATRGGGRRPRRLTEPAAVRWTLTAIALAFLMLFLILPLATVFVEALDDGIGAYVASIQEPDALAALVLP